MNIEILSLIFVSPLIAYSIHLLMLDSKDSLSGYHEEFARMKFAQSKVTQRAISIEKRKIQLVSEVLTSKWRELSVSLILLIILFVLGAGTRIVVIFALLISIFIFWEARSSSRTQARREAQIELELPPVVELFSILVSSGASPAVALLQISEISKGEFPRLLVGIREKLRAGGNLREALEFLSSSNSSTSIRRFCDSLIIAIERGSSLSDVLARQVEELRNSQKAALIRQASKVEISLMIPVVFLILPISILFALWPSFVALGTSVG